MPMKCQAHNAQGEPCKADYYKDGFCRWHHPEFKAVHREISRKGGKARSNAARAKKRLVALELDELDSVLGRALLDVLAGDLEPGLANAAANLARAIHQVKTASEIEQRIADLEHLVGRGRIA